MSRFSTCFGRRLCVELAPHFALLVVMGCQAEEHRFVPAEEFAELTGETALPVCDDGRRPCDEACRDLQSDAENCGSCGTVCESGVCVAGDCLECRSDEVVCDGACVSLASDAAHCGVCNDACSSDELCVLGDCESACPEGLTDCNGGCVELLLDPRHCGECGAECEAGELCSAGECRRRCVEPTVECDGACRDLLNDSLHCGRCGTVCASRRSGASTTCVEGECVPRTEDCTNGVDDNDDGLDDCEDPLCRGVARCLPRSPPGWTEPFLLVTGDVKNPPECLAPFETVLVSGLHQELIAEPAACACECTTRARCEVTVWFYDDVACLNDPWELAGQDALASSACEIVYFERDGTEGALSIWPETRVVGAEEGTECTLDSSLSNAPEWALDAVGCAPSAASPAGCNTGTCVADDGARYCVAQQGNQTCPVGFGGKRLMHTDFIDDRGCSPCECDFSCADSFLGYTDEDCEDDEQAIPANQPCSPLTADGTPEVEDALVWETRSFLVQAPSCEPFSEPTGAATATSSVTVCCESE